MRSRHDDMSSLYLSRVLSPQVTDEQWSKKKELLSGALTHNYTSVQTVTPVRASIIVRCCHQVLCRSLAPYPLHSKEFLSSRYQTDANPRQGDLRLPGPPSGQGAGGGARTRDSRVPADLRAVSKSLAA
ncbi:hypothetical protein PoB_004060100 [Plakobranchus ocellatus]|uniref:Uncharacterized protein n=1 Tax=Plakobranchus ocellatus TaxID=259542 RepID=A0AAV4ASJ3_9GAST|nr:hypothetical protein PoB_004060100 [Plakobranchus ocellatus]